MVWENVLCHIEPKLRHLSQDRPLLGHIILQNDIKATDTISRNHDQAVAVIIDLTYFSFFDWLHVVSLFLIFCLLCIPKKYYLPTIQ